VNLSPKGLDTFRILGPTTVAYVDFNGSGVETIAHLKENGRIVLMSARFRVRRIFSVCMALAARSSRNQAEFAALAENFPAYETMRSIIVIAITRVTDSCGYGVPRFKYEGEREQLAAWARKQGPEGLRAYRERKNQVSIDGLPGISFEKMTISRKIKRWECEDFQAFFCAVLFCAAAIPACGPDSNRCQGSEHA